MIQPILGHPKYIIKDINQYNLYKPTLDTEADSTIPGINVVIVSPIDSVTWNKGCAWKIQILTFIYIKSLLVY